MYLLKLQKSLICNVYDLQKAGLHCWCWWQVQTETATTRLIDLITVVTLLGTDVDLAKSAVSFCNVLQCVGLTSNNIT